MATFDAFALATAVGLRTPGLRLKLGPLAIGVRSPVAIALGGVLGGRADGRRRRRRARRVEPGDRRGLARPRVGAQRAAHARDDRLPARDPRGRGASDYDGRHVRSHGFRLRRPQPGTRIAVAAFGPAMTRVGARHADEVVLNLVPPERVRARARRRRGRGRGRGPHPPAPGGLGARRPRSRARRRAPSSPSQLAVYLGPAGLRRAVRRARVRRPRRARPGRARGAPSWPRRIPSSCSSRSARSAPPARSPRASPRTTTPAPTSSASSRRPPRTRAAGRRCTRWATASTDHDPEELAS